MNKKVERTQFKKNILKEIILRLDFQGVLQAEMERILLDVKPYLKGKAFNRYNEKVENHAVIEGSSIKDTFSEVIYSFSNDNAGYSICLSISSVIMNVRSVGYSPFEDYSEIFQHIVFVYINKIDFFTVTRFGFRKINFCFVRDLSDINKYFESKYYDVNNSLHEFNIALSNRNTVFTDGCKNANLKYVIEQGEINKQIYYKVSLDSDINTNDKNTINSLLTDKKEISKINDSLFNIFCDSITDYFAEILLDEDSVLPIGLVGVENNE